MPETNDWLLTSVLIIVKADEHRENNPKAELSAAQCVDNALLELEIDKDVLAEGMHDSFCAAVLCSWFTPVMAMRQIQKMISMAEAARVKAEKESS